MEIKNLSSNQLIDIFTKDDCINEELIKNFKYFNYQYAEECDYICAFKNNILVGILAFKKIKSATSLSYVTVHPEYRNQKIAFNLIEYLLKQINSGIILGSFYSSEGENLINSINRLANNYPLITIFHKINGSYQNAKFPVIEHGEIFEYKESNSEWQSAIAYDFYLNDDFIFCMEVSGNNSKKIIYPTDIRKK